MSPKTKSGQSPKRDKTALIFCGGGLTGFFYELGALLATQKILGEGTGVTDFDIFIGTSAGATLAALTALGVSPERVKQSVMSDSDPFFNPAREDIFAFSFKAPRHSVFQLGRLMAQFYRQALKGKGFRFIKTPGLFSEMMPDGFCTMDVFAQYWRKFLKKNHYPNNVDEVKKELYIVATHLDTAERTIFGKGHVEGVPIGKAITASSAVPGFLEPVRIGGQDYVDGAASDVAPIDLALSRGAKLIVVYNPMVPIKNDAKAVCVPSVLGGCAHLREKGFVKIFDQAMRAQVHSRLHVRLKEAQEMYPDVTILLVEPRTTETLIFLYNPMQYDVRKEILEFGTQSAQNLARRYAGRVKKAFTQVHMPFREEFFNQ